MNRLDIGLLQSGLLELLKGDIKNNNMSLSNVRIVYHVLSSFNESRKIYYTVDEIEKYNRTINIKVEFDNNLNQDEIISKAVEILEKKVKSKIAVVEAKVNLTMF